MIYIYLAGPILGCDRGEANDWRDEFSERLGEIGIVGVSPLRCEPLIGDRYSPNYSDKRFGTPSAIANKNMMDVDRCDLIFAYFPKELTARAVSIGTIIECAWAHKGGKRVIIVSESERITQHPVLNACAGWMLNSLDEGFETIQGLFSVYSEKPDTWGGKPRAPYYEARIAENGSIVVDSKSIQDQNREAYAKWKSDTNTSLAAQMEAAARKPVSYDGR